MAKALFAKYNSERSPRFRTSTVLAVKNRKKTVIKTPLSTEAVLYVENMYNSRERLAFAYEGSNLGVANCTKTDECILIDFVIGESLDEIIAKKTNGDKTLLKEEFRLFSELICGCGLVSFTPSEEFRKIFGDIEFANEQKCVTITSLALYTHNIIVDKTGVHTLVDFELCFGFSVPLNFLVYRALKMLKKRHSYKGIDSCLVLDITPEEKRQFRIMEERLDRYINDSYSLSEKVLADKFLKPQFDAVNKRYRTDGNNHRSCLFYDMGDGFCEQTKMEATSVLNGDTFEVRFNLPPIIGIKKLRFDPIEGIGSEIQILNATVDNEPLTLSAANCSEKKDDYDIFYHLDPIYSVKLEVELPPVEIVISYKLNTIDFETLYKITAEKLEIATAKKGILSGLFGKK